MSRNRREALLPLLSPEQQSRSSTGRQRSSTSPMMRRSLSGTIKVPSAAAAAAATRGESLTRQRDKFVPLPWKQDQPPPQQHQHHYQSPLADALAAAGAADQALPWPGKPLVPTPSIFEDLEDLVSEDLPASGRITVMCTAESYERKQLEAALAVALPAYTVQRQVDVLHASCATIAEDIFFFDYGVVVFWGLSQDAEKAVVRRVLPACQQGALSGREVEVDELRYHYSATEAPGVQNDVITISMRLARDAQLKQAISYALAQSTKLSVYEQRVMDLVRRTRHLPQALADHARVELPRREVTRLIGTVFLQRSAVTLLVPVLDTPEFFWSAPDHLQAVYKSILQYLELDSRLEVLNTRFEVLQQMLDMLRDHQNNEHSARLEWIVIWLILVECLIGLLDLAGLLGWVRER